MGRFFTKRVCFRFSLRAMLVFVTGVCVVLGWHANIVHQRRAAVAHIKIQGGIVEVWRPLTPNPTGLDCGTMIASHYAYGEVRVLRLRSWLGDQPVASVIVRSEDAFALARQRFPEAEIVRVDADDEVLAILPARIPPTPITH